MGIRAFIAVNEDKGLFVPKTVDVFTDEEIQRRYDILGEEFRQNPYSDGEGWSIFAWNDVKKKSPIFEYKMDNVRYNRLAKIYWILWSRQVQSVSQATVNNRRAVLEDVAEYENTFGKSLEMFNRDEVEYMCNTFIKLGQTRLMSTILTMGRSWIKFCNLFNMETNDISNFAPVNTRSETTFTRKEWLEVCKNVSDLSVGIVLFLVFIGVTLSGSDEKDEVRQLKKSDIHSNDISIGGEYARLLDINDEEYDFISSLVTKGYPNTTVRRDVVLGSPWLFPSAAPQGDGFITYQGVKTKINSVWDDVLDNVDLPLKPKHVRLLGKKNRLLELINAGMNEQTAAYQVGVEFGILHHNETGKRTISKIINILRS